MNRRSVAARSVAKAADSPWHGLREAHFLLRSRWTQELARFGLSYSDYVVLELCGRGPARASEVARALGLTAQGATDAIDRLEARGLVGRSTDRTDRRAIRIRLTSAGRRLRRQTHSAKRATARYLNSAMSAEERRALSEGLGALTRALRAPSRSV
ncbi:MAG TPA: MarR family transcriptional regulator [Thermoplasmata archaeon]|jgi:DNA-binding MarR family transcriptional regulator|nr:MarR family transcriptional regulator [Thermoplasmata archaeon]